MALKLAGSSSGFVALDAPASAGSNTLVLPADNGSNGEFLKTNGSGALDWATAGGGKVLQYVHEESSTVVETSGASEIEVIDATITPASSSNKILVWGFLMGDVYHSTNAWMAGFLYRGAMGGTEIQKFNSGYDSTPMVTFSVSPWIVDSPNTTSAQEYTMTMKRGSGGTNKVATVDKYRLMLVELEG